MAVPTPTPLAPDLEAALKRLKLRRIRQLAPEVLQTAKTQRWAPDEILRTLVEAEIAARDTSNLNARIRAANFPVVKTLEEFQLGSSSIPQATYDYLAGLKWIDAAENVVLVGPPGTGKSHLLIALGHAVVHDGRRGRYLTAAELVERLFARLADHTVGKTIDGLLRHHYLIIDELGFARSTPPGASCCSGSSPPATNAAPSGSRPTTPSRTGDGSYPSRPPPQHSSTGCCTTRSWSPPRASPSA